MITSNPGGKPPASKMKKPPRKILNYSGGGVLKQSAPSTTKKVKSFMKKYGQA